MDKPTLKTVLSLPYSLTDWQSVLRSVFGATRILQNPDGSITNRLNESDRELAKRASELGSFETDDDRIVGLYQVDLTDKPRIWQNRVGLRSLLRSVYRNDVDAALVVFVQGDKWRLSFISEIRVLNDDGSIETKTTQAKRFTYLLGDGERTKTATDRLYSLNGKKLSLDDIRVAFSVEALNNEFYKHVAGYFYELVGSTTKKGKETQYRDRLLTLPGVGKDDHKTCQEFAVRLIGRAVFCWFLREKKSDQGKSLLPETLLSSNAVRKNKNYYHSILEPLFFQTLNTPMDERIEDLPGGCDVVPFLNGGLFEPQSEDHYDFNRHGQTSNHINTLKIPDSWFVDFFEKLEEYNFTIDENSPTEVEISVDPEMLGRIFENLLAEIDPDSGETARKATGSFYTPREIVNYMVDESLILYLKGQLSTDIDESEAVEKDLRTLFSYAETENPFNKADSRKLIKAIDQCKILDPACGSGAFPIGALQRLVYLIGKLDNQNEQWKTTQIEKIDELIDKAQRLDDLKARRNVVADLEKRRREIVRDFAEKEVDFGRKLFLIENTIYGVDIQPIAAEISKLRCFLTLIVDDKIDETKSNRGVSPLPNLEFKFVTADTLLKLPKSPVQIGLFNSDSQMTKLEAVRHEYINSFGDAKDTAKAHFKKIQDEIHDNQIKNFGSNLDKRATALSNWDPFGHEKVNWFDSHWMFGVGGFDIVIGNPPYVQMQKDGGFLAKKYANENYETFERTGDIYSLFYEQGCKLLKKNGSLCFITSNKFIRANYGKSLRQFLWKLNISEIVDFGELPVFASAATFPVVLNVQNQPNRKSVRFTQIRTLNFESLLEVVKRDSSKLKADAFEGDNWSLASSSVNELIEKIKKSGTPLKHYLNSQIHRGITTGLNEAFIINAATKKRLIAEDNKSEEIIVPFTTADDIRKYEIRDKNEWLILSKIGINIEKYPAIFNHLKQYQSKLEKRWDKGNEWWELRPCAYYDEFTLPKILFPDIAKESRMTFVDSPLYVVNTAYVIPTNDKYLLAVLNSNVVFFFYSQIAAVLGDVKKGGRLRWVYQDVVKIPIPRISKERQRPFQNLVDYVLLLKETAEQLNDFVSNRHLAEQFEGVIDALVYELYFENDFRQADISFHKYAERDFPSIDGLSRSVKVKTIETAYQSLRKKDGEIRNNLKLMDIRLADLLGPIKSQR